MAAFDFWLGDTHIAQGGSFASASRRALEILSGRENSRKEKEKLPTEGTYARFTI